jgi:hypothetical protein
MPLGSQLNQNLISAININESPQCTSVLHWTDGPHREMVVPRLALLQKFSERKKLGYFVLEQ